MKKIYSLAVLALAGGMLANAQIATSQLSQTMTTQAAPVAPAQAEISVVAATEQQRTRGAQDMMGSYIWSYRSAWNQTGANDTIIMSLVEGTTDQVKVQGIWNGDRNSYVTGTLDAAKGTLTIPRQGWALNKDINMYPYFEKFDWGTGFTATTEPVVLTYYGGVWTTPVGTVFGIGNHPDATQLYPPTCEMIRFNNQFWGDVNWIKLGTTNFKDGFFSPAQVDVATITEKEVTVYRAAEGVDIFKVDGALFCSPNASMLIDATNPDNVMVPNQYSGYDVNEWGKTWYCNANYTMRGTFTPTEVNSCATYKDGVITFPANNGRFNWSTMPGENAQYVWYYNQATFECKLSIPKSQSAVADLDSDNAPVEYYNLQGVKVANPENGIFVRRQGSKAEKVIF